MLGVEYALDPLTIRQLPSRHHFDAKQGIAETRGMSETAASRFRGLWTIRSAWTRSEHTTEHSQKGMLLGTVHVAANSDKRKDSSRPHSTFRKPLTRLSRTSLLLYQTGLQKNLPMMRSVKP